MITLLSDKLTVEVARIGAEITSVKTPSGTEFIWQAGESWKRHTPVLFPIVGRLKEDRMTYKGSSYNLSQHGFARDLKFSVLGAEPDHCLLLLMDNEETRKKFPFPFELEIAHCLKRNELETVYTINNPGRQPLPFSIGAHPGFRCPIEPHETFEDYYLLFEKDSYQVTQLNNGLRTTNKEPLNLTAKKLKLSAELFAKDALVFEDAQINTITLASSKSNRRITMRAKDWPYLGIWTKPGQKEFLCLEPWYGIADHENHNGQFEAKDGIIWLEAGDSFSCSFSTTFL